MNDKQPEALRLADELLEPIEGFPEPTTLEKNAAALLRTQHTEIERLTSCLKWEQNRAERIGTHGPGCEKWGPAHYECALRAIERKDALLRQALDALLEHGSAYLHHEPQYEAAIDAITKELSQ